MIFKKSPAKVNLHLTVLRKRPDGYHDLTTLMQRISLCDEMAFSPLPRDILITCPGSSLPEDEGNIVYRAARSFFSHIGHKEGISITIRKNIPVAAGLGGGSSNAATTLMTLNEMTGAGCSKEELMELGKKLGADVPFFIFEKTAWATGIGDRLQEAANVPPLWFLLLNPGIPVSTKMVYENLNLRLTSEAINYSIPALKGGINFNLNEILRNDLETVTLILHPPLKQLKECLVKHGAQGALMSGSGPTVFGCFETEEKAGQVQQALTAEGPENIRIYLAHSL